MKGRDGGGEKEGGGLCLIVHNRPIFKKYIYCMVVVIVMNADHSYHIIFSYQTDRKIRRKRKSETERVRVVESLRIFTTIALVI